jgi:hypothetical protein
MATPDTKAIARGIFAEIANRFPSFNMVENPDDPVEISITMPVQPGLFHEVWLCLQNHGRIRVFLLVLTFMSSSSLAQNLIGLKNILRDGIQNCGYELGFENLMSNSSRQRLAPKMVFILTKGGDDKPTPYRKRNPTAQRD